MNQKRVANGDDSFMKCPCASDRDGCHAETQMLESAELFWFDSTELCFVGFLETLTVIRDSSKKLRWALGGLIIEKCT